ncbi:MAG: assimilatory nitrate reductase catalytic subunit, partial [Candidatus Azotimanducaceae bacterium]
MNLITSDGTSTTCPYCGVGCGVIASQEKNELLVVGDKLHPANHGQVCVKGDSLAETQTYAHRVTKARVNGEPESIDYAMSYIAEQFKTIIDTHGPNAIAFYLSGQLLTEDYYVANKLMKGFIGSANVDTNSRLCMASAVAAHKRAFGEDVVPCNYADLDEADLIVLAGSNMAWTHPVIYKRIQHARKTRGTRVVVIDPRETATCEVADLHLAIKPGSDTLLFNGLLRHLATVEAVDIEFVNQHTNDFDLSLASAGHSAAQISDGTALSQTSIETFFEWFARTKKTVTVFSQGINQA